MAWLPDVDFEFDAGAPLERGAGETIRANSALVDYYFMGPGRGLRKLHKKYLGAKSAGERPPTTRLPTLEVWSVRFRWQDRIEAQRGIDDAELAIKWSERRLAVAEVDWQQAESLRGLADKILSEGPNFIKSKRRVVKGRPRVVAPDGTVLDSGEPDQIIITLALDGQMAIRAAKAGSDLGRLATGLETGRQAVNVSGTVDVKQEVDLGNVDDSQLAAILGESGQFLMALSSRVGLSEAKGANEGIDTNPAE